MAIKNEVTVTPFFQEDSLLYSVQKDIGIIVL
jgi:hypothetical protein